MTLQIITFCDKKNALSDFNFLFSVSNFTIEISHFMNEVILLNN